MLVHFVRGNQIKKDFSNILKTITTNAVLPHVGGTILLDYLITARYQVDAIIYDYSMVKYDGQKVDQENVYVYISPVEPIEYRVKKLTNKVKFSKKFTNLFKD